MGLGRTGLCSHDKAVLHRLAAQDQAETSAVAGSALIPRSQLPHAHGRQRVEGGDPCGRGGPMRQAGSDSVASARSGLGAPGRHLAASCGVVLLPSSKRRGPDLLYVLLVQEWRIAQEDKAAEETGGAQVDARSQFMFMEVQRLCVL